MKEDKYEELLTRGYNAGYLLSRYEPKLYQQIMDHCDKEKPYFAGMVQGHRAAARELYEENLKKSQQINNHLKPRMK